MQRVCVFCGSNSGTSPAFAQAAAHLGGVLAKQGLEVVFGGGHVGLMGALADAALAGGAKVHGVIPRSLVERELAHRGVTSLRIVDNMHQRKQLMADVSDAFIALPGGVGTLDELCEILTWAQLGLHAKPIGLLDVAGYFQGLRMQLERARQEGLLRPEHHALLLVDTAAEPLLARMRAYQAPVMEKWIDRRDA